VAIQDRAGDGRIPERRQPFPDRRDGTDHRAAGRPDRIGQVHGDKGLVFDNQEGRAVNHLASPRQFPLKHRELIIVRIPCPDVEKPVCNK
jgi:hypothetical protein